MNAALLSKLAPTDSPLTVLLGALGKDGMDGFLAHLTEMEALMMRFDWDLYARGAQRPPTGAWDTWVIMAGRGFGKTRPGAEQVRAWAEELGKGGHIALVAKDPKDARDVMVEGESGILACSPPWFRPAYEPSKRKLTWPNGCVAHTYSSEAPDDLRGPQHHKLWGDEPCKWRYGQETWDNAELGLRVGRNPQSMLTTTPRPVPFLINILKEPGTRVTTGNTYENQVNLSPKWIQKILRKYEGTRLGQQELYAKMLTDTPGALWTLDQLEGLRVGAKAHPPLTTIYIGIDPPGTGPKDVMALAAGDEDDGTECGMVVGGVGEDGHLYITEDLSDVLSPAGWGARAIGAYLRTHANALIAEKNFGGDMVEFVLRTAAKAHEPPCEPAIEVVTASRGKSIRAEPIAALYEQKRVHHVGMFADLEDEMTTYVPGAKSPNRLDAMVWMASKAMLGPEAVEEWYVM